MRKGSDPWDRDAGRGRIVTVASAAGLIGVAGQTDDAASKLALPPLVRVVPALTLLPAALADRLADALGVDEGTDGFTGRAAAEQPSRRRRG